MASTKSPKADTLQPESGETVYAVKLDEDTIISVTATSAAEAEQKAKEQADGNDNR